MAEKMKNKEKIPFHVKWGWLGDGKDWRNDGLADSHVSAYHIGSNLVSDSKDPSPWCWSQTTKNWNICEQYSH